MQNPPVVTRLCISIVITMLFRVISFWILLFNPLDSGICTISYVIYESLAHGHVCTCPGHYLFIYLRALFVFYMFFFTFISNCSAFCKVITTCGIERLSKKSLKRRKCVKQKSYVGM